jgi:hypothetical protein
MKLNRYILLVTMLAGFVYVCGNIADAGVAFPKISVVPKSVNFGKISVTATSQSVITIQNTGASDLNITSVTIAGPGEFTETNNCAIVSPAGSCAITLTFEPTSIGNKNATLSISSNDPKKPSLNVKLVGTALPPKIAISPSSLNFGSIEAGNISLSRTVTINNAGISDLIIEGIGITGPNASEFVQENDCTTIAEGETCVITGAFKPTSAGKKRAMLSISSSDPKKPTFNVKLSGTASSPSSGTAIWDSSQWDNCSWGE